MELQEMREMLECCRLEARDRGSHSCEVWALVGLALAALAERLGAGVEVSGTLQVEGLVKGSGQGKGPIRLTEKGRRAVDWERRSPGEVAILDRDARYL